MFILHILVGVLTGILSGFGIGGGTVLMLYMTTLGALEQTTAQGVNLLYFLPCSAAAVIAHIKNHQIDLRTALFSVMAGLPCGVLGALAAQKLDAAWLRRAFGVLLLLVGARELFFANPGKDKAGLKKGDIV